MIFFSDEPKCMEKICNFSKMRNYSSVAVLCDTNTFENCYPYIVSQYEKHFPPLKFLVIDASEENKTLQNAAKIWEQSLQWEFDRKSLLINLCGGITTDLGGFAASTFKRGIDFINLPTSLPATIDTSIGGKTGIVFNGIKNSIGTFSQPKLSFIDIQFLKALPLQERTNGYAEMFKHTLLADKNLWHQLKNFGPLELKYQHINQSVRIKNKITEIDVFETGERKLLNLESAIEAFFMNHIPAKQINHREAIVAGISIESYISAEIGLLKEDQLCELTYHLLKLYKFIQIKPNQFENIIKLVKNDKKNKDGVF